MLMVCLWNPHYYIQIGSGSIFGLYEEAQHRSSRVWSEATLWFSFLIGIPINSSLNGSLDSRETSSRTTNRIITIYLYPRVIAGLKATITVYPRTPSSMVPSALDWFWPKLPIFLALIPLFPSSQNDWCRITFQQWLLEEPSWSPHPPISNNVQISPIRWPTLHTLFGQRD